MLSKLKQYFYKPIDNSQIILFRMLFGFLMAIESFGAIGTGWVRRTLVEPQFTFSFIGLDWLQPLPGNGMYFYFAMMGVVSLMVMVGYFYRFTSILLAVMWTAVYFMQKTSYNNHYYLVMLLLWWMAFMNAHRYAALDVKRTGIVELVCPNWYRLFFILQVFLVFTFGALAKLYPGWSEGDFIRNAFSSKTNYWLIGPLLGKAWFQQFITFGGVFFDGLIVPALLWKRTRFIALIGLLAFNIFNSVVFQIGIFPYAMIALAIFFFEPETIRRIFFKKKNLPKLSQNTFSKNLVFPIFIIYFIFQTALPLRHHFIPGDVNWREEGHRMSWRMMLRSKSGSIILEAVQPDTQKKWIIKKQDYITRKQVRNLATKPDFLWQFIQHLKKDYAAKGMKDVEIYCKKSVVRLNSNKGKPFYKSDIDLTKVDWNYFGRNEWVLD